MPRRPARTLPDQARAKGRRETYHHGDLQRALISAAIELISQGNPEQITLREVSRRVGVNHRAVYRHFADLTALLAAVAEEGYRQLVDALREAVLGHRVSAPQRRLEALACAYIAFALDHQAHYRIMFGRRLNEDGRFPVLEEVVKEAWALLDAEIASGIERGTFVARPRRELVFSFWSLAHGFASLALVRRIRVKRALLDPYARQIVAPFVAGLRVR